MLEQRVIKNTIAQLFARLFDVGTMVVLTIAIGRFSDAQELGKFSVIITITTVFLFATDFGLNRLLFRELSRHKDRRQRYINNALTWAALCSSATIPIVVGVSAALGYESEQLYAIFWGAVWVGIGALATIFRSAFYASERMAQETITLAVEKVLALGAGLPIIIFGGGLGNLMMALAVSRLANLALSAVWYHRYFGQIRPSTDWRLIRHLVSASIPFGLNIVCTAIYIHSDILVIAQFRATEEVGFYKAAAALVIPLTTLAVVVNNTLTPTLARAFAQRDFEAFEDLLLNLIRYGLLGSVLISVVMITFAQDIIALLYGSGFEAAVPALWILGLIIPFRIMDNTLGTALTNLNRQGARTYVIGIAAAANLLMNLLIVPSRGYIGACWTTVVTEVMIFAMLCVYIRRAVGPLRWPSMALLSPLVGGGTMYAVFLFLHSWPTPPRLAIGLFTYLIVLYLLRGFNRSDVMKSVRAIRSLRNAFEQG